jgi:hypothetical protein
LCSFSISPCLLYAMNYKLSGMSHRNVGLNIPVRSSIKYPDFRAILRNGGTVLSTRSVPRC